MRRLILSALVLLPVLASAQTSTSTATQPSATSNTLMARATPPAPFAAAAAKPAAPDASDIMVPVNQTVVDDGANVDNSSSLYIGASRSTAPVLIHAVPVVLSLRDLRTEDSLAEANVVVRLKVSSIGAPSSLVVMHSAGSALDQRALAAISQYRFSPATQAGLPVDSEATVSIAFKTR